MTKLEEARYVREQECFMVGGPDIPSAFLTEVEPGCTWDECHALAASVILDGYPARTPKKAPR